MVELKKKAREGVLPGKVQVNWRIYRKVFNALRADADRRGFSSIPMLLNHLLTQHYFGDAQLKSKEK